MTSEQFRQQRNNSDKRNGDRVNSLKKKKEISDEKAAFSKVKKMTDKEKQNAEFGSIVDLHASEQVTILQFT